MMFVRLLYNRQVIQPGNFLVLEYNLGVTENTNKSNYEYAVEIEQHLKEILPFTFITDMNTEIYAAMKLQKIHNFGPWANLWVAEKEKPNFMVMGFSSEKDKLMGRLIV